MATIASNSVGALATITRTTLGASDTFTYDPSIEQILVLDNVTGGALTPNVDGADGTTVNVQGLGSVSVASGYTFASIAAGAIVAIPLKSIALYCQGLVTVTGGTGIKAHIIY